MAQEKYTAQNSTIQEVLSEARALDFMNQMAPGMADSPVMSYLNGVPLAQLMENMPDKRDLFQALLDLANGKEISVTVQDPKKVLPRVNDSEEFVYDIDDVDGRMYMLDHGFSGCLVVRFTKEMDEAVYGKVTCGGMKLPQGMIKKMEAAGGIQMFGIPVRDICTEYAKEYTLHLEGFMDVDGNTMEPQDIMVRTLPMPERDSSYAEHDAVALQAAREGIVLLKNEGHVLPLSPDCELEVKGANQFRLGAVGAGKINPRYYMNLKRALKECSGFQVREQADTGVIVISRASGENYDNNAAKGEFYLTEAEEETVREMTSRCSKVVAVINSGYPMDLRWTEKYGVKAVVWCGFPGMLGGQALVEILDGRVNPSGKLPDTWSLDYFDIPSSANFYLPKDGEAALSADSPYFVDTFYEEDIYVGYRYFETFKKPVAYPFGFGLSYTDFTISAQYKEGRVKASVTNTGDRAGKEVVQIYVQIPDGKLEQPDKRLVGFAKTKCLEPGETQELEIGIPEKNLSSFDTDRACWILEPGEYTFYAGNCVNNVDKCGTYCLDVEKVIFQSENLMKLPVEMEVLSKKNPDFPRGTQSGLKKEYQELTPKTERRHYTEAELSVKPEGLSEAGKTTESADTASIAADLAAQLSIEELARFSICASHGWGMHETGEAGRIYRLEGRDLPRYAVADGNNGVNVNRPNIGMPCSNTVCATWNRDIPYEVGRVIAEEAKENDISMILAPAMNIHRNPLNGRHPEYFSEDPYLAGIMAGYQSKGLEEHGVSSSMKHVIANNCEAARKRNHSFITERALREIYLKVFEYAISVHQPDSIMTSYNACNGCFAAEDEELIQGIFRREFGFDGFVMTDWNSYDTADVAEAVRAGNCWMTPGTTDDTYVRPIIEGVENGRIEEERLRSNVRHILEVVLK